MQQQKRQRLPAYTKYCLDLDWSGQKPYILSLLLISSKFQKTGKKAHSNLVILNCLKQNDEIQNFQVVCMGQVGRNQSINDSGVLGSKSVVHFCSWFPSLTSSRSPGRMDLQCKISFILWLFQDQKVIHLALFLSNFCFLHYAVLSKHTRIFRQNLFNNIFILNE